MFYFVKLGWVRRGLLRWGMLDDCGCVLETFDVLNKPVPDGYEHLEVKICK
jgi:hypothetical protein